MFRNAYSEAVEIGTFLAISIFQQPAAAMAEAIFGP
jgi:hypothetical protein